MATKLFLRNTQANGIGATYYDMVTSAGASADTSVTNTTASGTEIQITKTAGGAVVQWISGRVPSGGFTLTSTDISVWAKESNNLANCGGRFRVFKRAANGTETELGGGPFNDGVEFTTSDAEYLWVGNVTDTAFAEDDRVLLKVYITNVGTMDTGRTCTITYNAANAATGDSFFNLAETVAFKPEPTVVAVGQITETDTANAIGRIKAKAIGQVTEADAANAIFDIRGSDTRFVLRKTGGSGSALKSTAAFRFAAATQTIAVGQVTETDTANAITARKTRALSQPTETDSANAIAHAKTRSVGQAVETDTSQPFAVITTHIIAVGQVVETDTAQAITKRKTRAVGQISETDQVFGLGKLKSFTIGLATETDTAQQISRNQFVSIGQATETDIAQAITWFGPHSSGGTLGLLTSLSVLSGGASSSSATKDGVSSSSALVGAAGSSSAAKDGVSSSSGGVGNVVSTIS